jgi:hypothetical protein
MVDAHGMRFDTVRYDWDPDNPLSGQGATHRSGSVE